MAKPLPPQMRSALRRHVRKALSRLDPNRYRQEPAYVAGLMSRLDDVVYKGAEGRLEIRSTIVTDRGSGSAESIFGADFAITAVIQRGRNRVEKAVVGQAKRGSLISSRGSVDDEFLDQCVKMTDLSGAIIGLEVPTSFSDGVLVREVREPLRAHLKKVTLGRDLIVGPPQELGDYLVDRFLPCTHGDSSTDTVAKVADSRLPRLDFYAETTD